MTTTVELAPAPPRHDCADRRHSNMEKVIAALDGCVDDLTTYPGDFGIAYSVAGRIARLNAELAQFRARDLLNMRAVQS